MVRHYTLPKVYTQKQKKCKKELFCISFAFEFTGTFLCETSSNTLKFHETLLVTQYEPTSHTESALLFVNAVVHCGPLVQFDWKEALISSFLQMFIEWYKEEDTQVYIVACQAHPVLVKSGSNVRSVSFFCARNSPFSKNILALLPCSEDPKCTAPPCIPIKGNPDMETSFLDCTFKSVCQNENKTCLLVSVYGCLNQSFVRSCF